MKKARVVPRPALIAVSLLILLMLAMFADVLFAGGTRVLGNQTTDLYLQFISWRDFGFRQLAHGNLALWNPHIYSGAPYFGGLQAALLYPPNFVFLMLPLPLAINWSIALHVLLMGLFTFWWASRRGLHPAAAFLAGALMMFCGPHFMHIYAGHLTNLCAMVWAPLVFLAIDGFFEKRLLGWCLLGMFAVAMQIFAGHPQYLFYTAIAAGLYSAFRLIGEKRPGGLIAGLLSIYPGGAALGAVQLLTGMQASAETIRNISLPYQFASMFSFPPENFLTLIVPGFFGDMTRLVYWGRCYLWEMSLFIGVTGLVLAIYGAAFARAKTKWILIAMPLILLLLALGAHTPLFDVLYDFAPGFDKFRSISKFIFQASLFLALLAAMGLDQLLRRRRAEPRAAIAVLAGAGLLFAAAIWVGNTNWKPVMQSILATKESYLPPAAFENAAFVEQARSFACDSLLISAGICVLLAALLGLVGSWAGAVYAIAGMAVLEVFVFAWNSRETFDSASVVVPEIKQFLDAHPGDYRIINLLNANSAMSMNALDMWGADPGVVRRYAEFIAFTQGSDPDKVTQYVNFTKLDPLYTMLRFRFAFVPRENGFRLVEAQDPPMPRLQLVQRYRVFHDRDTIFAAMRDAAFDPRREVILERAPEPEPASSDNPGSARVVDSSTDFLTVEADLKQPSILLITDVYTPAWRAVPLPGSVQSHYDLQPANYMLLSIPLAAGHHRLRVEYAPRAFEVGKWISILSAILFCAALAWRRRAVLLPWEKAARPGSRAR